MATFPSEVVSLEVAVGDARCDIHIPRDEVFRVGDIFERGEYAVPDELARQVTTIVDIGANVGTFALYAKLAINAAAEIHCFEPAPDTFELLARNVAPYADVHAHEEGLSDFDGSATLHLCHANTGQHSLKFRDRVHDRTVQVPVRDAGKRFDALGIERADVLKIDTEGSEVEVLRSLGDRLRGTACVLVEYHGEDDRRAIDLLLGEFHLYAAKIPHPGNGVLKYVRVHGG